MHQLRRPQPRLFSPSYTRALASSNKSQSRSLSSIRSPATTAPLPLLRPAAAAAPASQHWIHSRPLNAASSAQSTRTSSGHRAYSTEMPAEEKILFRTPVKVTGGEFVCTEPAPRVYLLSFNSPPDNRLTTHFIEAFCFALDLLEFRFKNGVVVTTSSIPKFYSNGLDLEHVSQTPGFRAKYLYKLFHRLLTFPWPTIALYNGHAFAGGFMIGMFQDYRIMNPSKGFLCLNEVLFGAVMDAPMLSIFRDKLAEKQTYRSLVLEGQRYTAQRALEERVIDGVGGLDETLKFIADRDLVSKGDAGVMRQLKEQMYRETLYYCTHDAEDIKWREEMEEQYQAYKKAGMANVVASRFPTKPKI